MGLFQIKTVFQVRPPIFHCEGGEVDGYSILAENKEFSKLCTEGLAASDQLLGTGYAADLREARVGSAAVYVCCRML